MSATRQAAWTRSFMIERRYAKFPGLILAFVWRPGDHERAVTDFLPRG